MGSNQSVHPARDRLTDYGLGKLQAAEAEAVETHIAECEECCETLLDLGSDTFVDLVCRSDAVQLDSVDEGTIGLRETDGETVCDLPDELTNHPRYRVLELLGKGGMGDVYKAEHRMMQRTVALKVIKRELMQNPQAVERFEREVRAAASLAHGNIVAAYDAERAGDVHFLVMEFVAGTDLAEVVKQRGQISVADACDYICQAAEGLQHAHEQRLVHRDIKPHNLMLTAEGTVKILDFGLASLTEGPIDRGETVVQRSDLTAVGTIMGTPDYISPEQATDARAADIRSDIYSLGATLYFLLAGRPPFDEGTVVEKLKSHAESEAERIDEVRVDVPAEVADVIRRAMSKDPGDRFQTPSDLADALAPFVEKHRSDKFAVPAKPQPGGRGTAWSQIAVAAAAVVVLGVLAVVLYLMTDYGTLVVESDDENLKIAVHRLFHDSFDGAKGRDVWNSSASDNITGSTTKRLKAGAYIVFLPDTQEFELSQRRLVLQRGGKVTIRVRRKSRQLPLPPATANKTLANMELVLIPAGQFIMGTPQDEKGLPDQRQHPVKITQPFHMGMFEITQQEYEWVMGENPSVFSVSGVGKDVVSGQDTNRFPVERVSWEDAVEFCRRLSALPEARRAGHVYRLPTEAEWEYACRAGTTTTFHFGRELNGTQANVDGQHPWGTSEKGPALNRTTAVGSYQPNVFGLHDMHGNVWEWCSDLYGIDTYANSRIDDPRGPSAGTSRVVRGGGWNYGALQARAAARDQRAPDYLDVNLGFRVVRVSKNPDVELPHVQKKKQNAKDPATDSALGKERLEKNSTISNSIGKTVTIRAGLMKGYSLGSVRQGSAIHFQYVSGQWKGWGRLPDISPDKTEGRGEERCRLAIVAFPSESNSGDVLQLVPEGTSEKPFVFHADRDFHELAMRINDDDGNCDENPGHVQYKVHVEPP